MIVDVNGEYFLASGCEDGTVAIHVIKDLDMADAPGKKVKKYPGGNKALKQMEIQIFLSPRKSLRIAWVATKAVYQN